MGTCYSKNTVGAGTSSESKRPKQKHRDSQKNGRISTDELLPESCAIEQSEKSFEKTVTIMADKPSCETSRSSTPDTVLRHLNEKIVDPGVVPSDSGIESIGNVQDDAGEKTQSEQEKYDFSNKLEQLTRDSYHTCGNFNVGSTFTSALLTDDSCGARQAGRLAVNPQCKTHGAQQNKSSSSACYTNFDLRETIFPENGSAISNDAMTDGSYNCAYTEFKSTGKKSNTTNKDRSIRVAKHSVEDLNACDILLSQESSQRPISEIFSGANSNHKAPLAVFDSIEANLNHSLSDVNQKRQSLLSEILDITESLCKCDFYSSEYCTRDHRGNASVTEVSSDAFSSEIGASGEIDKSGECLDHFDKSLSTYYKGETLSGVSTNTSQTFSTPSKKGFSLPKNVSFATHEEISNESLTEPASAPVKKCPLTSAAAHYSHFESNMLESSSGGYTHKTASELILSDKRKDFHKRSASLGSVRAVMSDSSSDAPDCGTEDDVASLDLDSISRVTSLSYNSIRQLMESTDDLASPRFPLQPVTINGVDCIVIPTEAYRQMQTDLATFKQQLLYLSSLMQEGAENL